MKSQGSQGTKNMWRWWCGGGVIAVAVVLGCTTAVEFKDSGREAGSKVAPLPSLKRGIAAERAQDYPHNGGKATMPVTASFDGDMTVTINRDTTLIVAIAAEADITAVRGSIEGLGGLKGRVSQRLDFTEIGSGETRAIQVRVPAVTGSLAVSIEGLVSGNPMSTTLELKINPKTISTSNLRSGAVTPTQAGDMGQAPVKDATGQVVEPMKAREER